MREELSTALHSGRDDKAVTGVELIYMEKSHHLATTLSSRANDLADAKLREE
jgi:hypothetical protein